MSRARPISRCVACTGAAALLVAAALVAPRSSHAADATRPSWVPTLTRGVKLIFTLENDLQDALLGGDAAIVSKLVAEDFEQRCGAAPGQPMPRTDWLQQAGKAKRSAVIEQMAVHDHGDLLLASFRRSEAGRKGGTFVVDAWKRHADGWQLVTRYVSGACYASPSAALPVIEKKY